MRDPRGPVLFALCVLVPLAACASVQPRVGTGGPAAPDGPTAFPRPAPGVALDGATRPAFLQVCRSAGRTPGYIAIRYTVAGDECPQNLGGDDPYNGAVLERYVDRPVGSVMTVCADQSVPAGWVVDRRGDARGQCPGARVADGAATTRVVRRVDDVRRRTSAAG